MDAMFIRHNMESTRETLEKLWSRKLIAVHFKNEESTKPEHYDSAGERALKRLWKYCESGAIVGADFYSLHPKMLVGEIEPKSEVKPEKIGNYIYKIVQLTNTKEVSYRDYPLLAAIKPRGTITGWPSAQKHLEAIIEEKEISREVNSLHPCQLEIMCYEFLLKENILATLLMPIGRSLPDIDIVGINGQGKYIFAQVTHSTNSKEIEEKIEKLKSYKSNSTVIFFGPESQKKEDADVKYVSIEEVFRLLTSNSKSIYYKMIDRMLKPVI